MRLQVAKFVQWTAPSSRKVIRQLTHCGALVALADLFPEAPRQVPEVVLAGPVRFPEFFKEFKGYVDSVLSVSGR